MKLLHLSDLHLGKRVNDMSMLEEQTYVLAQILSIAEEEKPQAVLIAGDVYDKAVPSAEAVELLDDFLCGLAARKLQVFLISGNHDSPERLSFAGRLLQENGIHLSGVYHGRVDPIVLHDSHGAVAFYLLPFLKPAHVRRYYPEAEVESYTDAVRTAVAQMNPAPEIRNVLLTHQFVTGALRCDSEEISVGGSDHVDAEVFEAFDYVALGHLHRPQNVGSDRIRYCGTPLKYSFSEAEHEKSVTIVELEEKGVRTVRTRTLTPLHDMRQLRGTYAELTAKENYDGTAREDYLHMILTDEEDVPEAVGRLRVIYPNLMKLTYDNTRTRRTAIFDGVEQIQKKTPLELLRELYELQNNQPMNELQERYAQDLIETIWGQQE